MFLDPDNYYYHNMFVPSLYAFIVSLLVCRFYSDVLSSLQGSVSYPLRRRHPSICTSLRSSNDPELCLRWSNQELHGAVLGCSRSDGHCYGSFVHTSWRRPALSRDRPSRACGPWLWDVLCRTTIRSACTPSYHRECARSSVPSILSFLRWRMFYSCSRCCDI